MIDARAGGVYTEGFELAGPEMYHGINCWVLHSYGPNYVRWYVGVDDHLMHGWTIGLSYDKDPRLTQLVEDIAGTNAPDVQSMGDFYRWVQTLPRDQSKAISQKVIHEWGRLGPVRDDFWLMDYKEVAPGKLFPMTQGSGNASDGSTRELHAVEVTIDQPLPDDLFKMEIKDGAQVYDGTRDPPLFYKAKHDRTPEEWQQIIDKAVAQKKMFDDEKTRENAMVGKPAVPFPKTTWLNGGPVTWEVLKGKVVILDFFAEWCGPCRNDWPTLAAMHKKRDQTGIVIIGIHTPGSPQAKIDAVMKQFDMQYPICIDLAAPEGAKGFGLLSVAYGVNSLPHTVVVGPDGIVAGHGQLAEMLQLAYELAAKQKATTQPTTRP
jgi:thiol-disulfide isomerase/thioredoxin